MSGGEGRCEGGDRNSSSSSCGKPVLREIQYTGSANRVPAILQQTMAVAFVQAHKLNNDSREAQPT